MCTCLGFESAVWVSCLGFWGLLHPISRVQVQLLTAWTARRLRLVHCSALLPLESTLLRSAHTAKVRGLGHTQSFRLPSAEDATGTQQSQSTLSFLRQHTGKPSRAQTWDQADVPFRIKRCCTRIIVLLGLSGFAGAPSTKDSPEAAVDRSITKGPACRFFVARGSCASDPKLGGVRLVHFGCFEQAQEQLDEAQSQQRNARRTRSQGRRGKP